MHSLSLEGKFNPNHLIYFRLGEDDVRMSFGGGVDDDYYEIGDNNMSRIVSHIEKTRSASTKNHVVTAGQGEAPPPSLQAAGGDTPRPGGKVVDIYAKVDKSKKTKAKSQSAFQFSISKDSCSEEDRDLNEMWMVGCYDYSLLTAGCQAKVHLR